jgi:hypothetical protein
MAWGHPLFWDLIRMSSHPLTELPQEQLDWISRFTDRLRLEQPEFGKEDRGIVLNDLARDAWERGDWRSLGPEAAADRWLERRSLD